MPTGALRAEKKRRTRAVIADAAAVLFADRGFDAVTIDDVARRARVSRQTVFNHFATKEDLVFDREPAIRDSLVAVVRDTPDGTPLVEAFRRATHEFFELLRTPPAERPTGFWDVLTNSPGLRAHGHRLAAGHVELVAAEIAERRGAAAGDLRPRTEAAALLGVREALFHRIRERVATGEAVPDFLDEVLADADRAFDLLATGLAAGDAERQFDLLAAGYAGAERKRPSSRPSAAPR